MVNSWLRKLAPRRPGAPPQTQPSPDAAKARRSPPVAPGGHPGPPRLTSHERLPGGYTKNIYGCRCWNLTNDTRRVIFEYVCGGHLRSELDQWLESVTDEP